MKKNYIKQLFALLLVTLFAGNANAQDEVVFNFNEMNLDMSWQKTDTDQTESTAGDINEEWTKTISGVTVAISPKEESASNPNRFWRIKDSNGDYVPQLRCYSGTITISAESNFSKIEFNATNNFNLTPDKGVLANKIWTHEGTGEVVFTVSKNTQINSITVTMGSGEVIEINAEDKTIADLVGQDEAIEYVNLQLNNAKVVYKYDTSSNQNVFVREGDNAINFYSTGLDLPLNATLSGSVIVGYKKYNNLSEVIATSATNADNLTITPSTTSDLDPVSATISEILNMTYTNDLVRIDNVTIEEEIVYKEDGTTIKNTNYYANDVAGNRLQLYGNNSAVKDYAGQTVNIIAVFNSTYQGTPQVRPVQVVTGDDPGTGDETEVADIEAFKALGAGKQATLKLNGALVLFAKGDDVFVHDQSGAIDFYKTGINFTTGQLLNGSIFGEYKEFRSLPELVAVEGKTNDDDIDISNGTVTPLTGIDLGEVASYACELVTVTLTISKDGNNFYGEDADGNKLQVYDKFGIGYPTTDIEGNTYDITGIIIPFNTTFEIAPTEDFVGGVAETCENIAAFKALEDGSTAVLTLTNAQVLYVAGNDAYVKDASGAIDFFKSGLQLKAGDILNGTIKAKFTVYNNTPELTGVAESDIEISAGTVTPETMVARTAALPENICNLVRIENVSVFYEETTNEESTKTYQNWYDSSNKFVQFYDKWNIGYELTEGETYTFTGIMVLYNEQPEMYVTVDPTNAGATAISNVNAAENANAPVFNLAGQRVNNAVKGIYIQNGKKFVVK